MEAGIRLKASFHTAMVTGAAGFIGSKLVQALQSGGARVAGVDARRGSCTLERFREIDIASPVDGELFERDSVVFHLAGKVHALSEVRQDDQEYFRINTEGTRNVLEAAQRAGVRRLIFFSTIKAMSRDGVGGRATDDSGLITGKGEHRTFNAELSTFKEGTTEDGGRRAECRKDELSTSNIQHSTLNTEQSKKLATGDQRAEGGGQGAESRGRSAVSEEQRDRVTGNQQQDSRDQLSSIDGLRAFNEEDVIEPDTPYGKSKLEAEKLVLQGGYVPEPVVLRLCMVYGPGAKGNMQKMLQAVAKHRFPPLPEVNNKRSMVHVQDVVNAAILAAERPEAVGQTFIVSDGHSYSTRQMYELMCQALGRHPPKWSIPIPCLRALGWAGDAIGKLRGKRFMFDSDALEKLIGSAWFSSQKIETMLGFKPEWNLEKALPEMVEAQSAESKAPSG